MTLKRGLYVTLFAKRKDNYENDFSNHSRWLGAKHVGEIPNEFRQSFFLDLLERLDSRFGKKRSFGIDCHADRLGIPVTADDCLGFAACETCTKIPENDEKKGLRKS